MVDTDVAELRKEVLRQWETNHSEYCTNRWPHDGNCKWPVPETLKLSLDDVYAIMREIWDEP
jgi:hypothetical protein